MYCNNCGEKISDNSRFCNQCGADIGVVKLDEKHGIIIQPITETPVKKRRMPIFELIVAGLCVFFITFMPLVEYNGVSYSCLNILNEVYLADYSAKSICILGWGLTVSASVGYFFLVRAERYVLSILIAAVDFAVLCWMGTYEKGGVSFFGVDATGMFVFFMILGSVASIISKKISFAIFSRERKKMKAHLKKFKSDD